MGSFFTESDWNFENFQSVSVKFTPLYRGHDFYRKWLKMSFFSDFLYNSLPYIEGMTFTETGWKFGILIF